MCKKVVFVLMFVHLCHAEVWSDQITLKNGDRLTGTIVKLEGSHLILKSDLVGTVTAPWAAVVDMTAGQPLYVTLKDGKTVVGAVSAAAEQLDVQTVAIGRMSIAKDKIHAIRAKSEQMAHEASLQPPHPRPPQSVRPWQGFMDVGFSASGGNTATSILNLGVNAVRPTRRGKVAVHFRSLYVENSAVGRSVLPARAVRGGSRYDVTLRGRMAAFAFLDLESDRLQRLDLRTVLGGGLNFSVYQTPRTTLDGFAGGSYHQASFAYLKRTSGDFVAGLNLSHKMSDRVSLTEKLVIYPNMMYCLPRLSRPNFNRYGEYRTTLDVAVVTRLNQWLNWQVTFNDRYYSHPPPRVKKNDTLLTTGVRVTFGGGQK